MTAAQKILIERVASEIMEFLRGAVAACVLTLLSGCSQGTGDPSTGEALSAALREGATTQSEVSLPKGVAGAWTRVLFVCPYEDQQSVNDRLGFVWNDFPGPDDSEGRVTYVFASANAVVTWATINRDVGDACSAPASLDTVSKESAVFTVVPTDTTEGKPFYSLVQRSSL